VDDNRELNIVTGAFGYSGKYITERLLARGMKVRTLTGHPNHPNPFGDKVEVAPFNFDNPDALAESLRGATTVYNTYWIRFERGDLTFNRAVRNVETLIDAARRAGVRRFVHISITYASADSPLPYFHGKGVIENFLRGAGIAHAIIRPAIIFGPEDILINNIAWSVRRFPLFAVPGDGEYRLQPVFVEDLADMLVNAGQEVENIERDAVGPEIFSFNQLIRTIARTLGRRIHLLHVPPTIALAFTSLFGLVMHDVMLTRDEIQGLSHNLLISHDPQTAPTHLSKWLARNAATLGVSYASELAKRA